MIDSHVHLQDKRLESRIAQVVLEAKQAKVEQVVCCATCEEDWQKVLDLHKQYPDFIIPSVGLHPWYLPASSSDWLQRLEQIIANNICSVGEIGLDYVIKGFDSLAQMRCLKDQISLACKYDRPVTIHCRSAWEDLFKVLENFSSSNLKGIIHSYSGGLVNLHKVLSFGLLVSFSGAVMNPKNLKAIDTLAAVPLDKIVLETDSPDMPVCGKNTVNEPKNIGFIVTRLSQILQKPEQVIIRCTSENSKKIFGCL